MTTPNKFESAGRLVNALRKLEQKRAAKVEHCSLGHIIIRNIRARDAAVRAAALRPVLALADKLDRDGMAEAVSVGDCYARAATRECAAEVRALAETGGSDAC